MSKREPTTLMTIIAASKPTAIYFLLLELLLATVAFPLYTTSTCFYSSHPAVDSRVHCVIVNISELDAIGEEHFC
jgi:hypothetical protein